MRAMLVAFVACAVIAAAAPTVLRELGYTVETTRASDSVRLDSAGK